MARSNGAMPDRLPAHQPNERFDFVAREKEVLAYWRQIDAFKESVRQSVGRKPYTFYDGPPRLLVGRQSVWRLKDVLQGRRLRLASRTMGIC
jgi:isoleucyl-tRNA synthetase